MDSPRRLARLACLAFACFSLFATYAHALDTPTTGAVAGNFMAGGGTGSPGFSVVLKSNGEVWAWGSNVSGQFGDGTTASRVAPGLVPGLTNVAIVAAGGKYLVAVKNDGTVWAVGDNAGGQLGDGSTTQRLSPVQVSGVDGDDHSVGRPVSHRRREE